VFEAVGQLMLLTHFSELASGSNKTRVPYTDLADRTSLLVDPKYLPSGFDFKFKDPRNMTKEAIDLFFLMPLVDKRCSDPPTHLDSRVT